MEHKRYSRAAAERRRLWFERHQRLPTRVLGPDDELLFALVHRLIRPTLLTPIPSHRVTADLAWRVAFERAAVMVTVRGQLVASIEPLAIARECEGLGPDDLLRCDTKDFRRRRNAVLAAMTQGQQHRVVLQYHDLLLAHLGPVPPRLTRRPIARRSPQPGPVTNDLRLSEEPDDAEEQPGEPAVGLEEAAANRSPAVPGMPVAELPPPPLTSEQAGRAEDHISLVRRLAQRASHLAGTKALSCNEFRSVGNEALVDAARRYDPERRASFSTFAGYRVFGAMMDAVRKHSRSGSRHEPLTHRDQASGPSPEQALIAADERRRLSLLVSGLELHEQALVEALYIDERTMTDIASETGVHTSTISRRHAQILDRLGKRMVAQERGSVSPDVVRFVSRRDS